MPVYALIPAHNEAETIGPVVRGCLAHGHKVIVIDDHCTDGTAECARLAGAEVWVHRGMRGKASGLRWGWKRLAEDPVWTHLLLLDGDGQHDPRDIPDLLALAPGCDLVIGSRAPFQDPMPRVRRWVNSTMSWLLSRRTGWPIPDSQSGFRIVSRRLIERGRWTSCAFELESEMILQAWQLGYSFACCPVACRYGGRSSHIQPWTDTWRWLLWWGRSARPS